MLSSSLLVLLAAVGTAFAQTTPDIVGVLSSTPSLSTLKTTLEQFPDLVTLLGSAEDITVLAPSNEAFEKLMADPSFKMISGNKEILKAILSYHVLNGTVASTDFSKTPAFPPTLLGDVPMFRNLSGEPQVVKAVLQEEKATLYSGLGMKSEVSTADVKFSGGVAHIIDSVLSPPMGVSYTAKALNLTSLVDALIDTDLVSTVDSLAKVTIFAPSNEAFMAIKTLPPKDQLASILTYHVVPNTLGYSSGLTNGMKLKTVNGADLLVRVDDTGVFINQAKVSTADILVNSGVVHVIDSVLSPDIVANITSMPSPTGTTPPMSTGAASVLGWSGLAVVGGVLAAAWGMM